MSYAQPHSNGEDEPELRLRMQPLEKPKEAGPVPKDSQPDRGDSADWRQTIQSGTPTREIRRARDFRDLPGSEIKITVDAYEQTSWFSAWNRDVHRWCQTSSLWPRLPVFALVVYWTIRHIADAEYVSLFGAINLGIHEIGHVVFSVGGEWLHFIGGTALQLMAPAAALWVMLRQRDYFALSFILTWGATNLYGVATYIGDARARALPLVSLGNGEPQHDWEYLLGRAGLLQQDLFLAGVVRGMGMLTFGLAVAWGGWLLWKMATDPKDSVNV